MRKFNSLALLDELEQLTRKTILQSHELSRLNPVILAEQPQPGAWSILQIIEHLNSYGRFYLPAMEKSINESGTRFKPTFKASLLGNFFTNLMKPDPDGRINNKMKTPKDHRPEPVLNSRQVLEEFYLQQQSLLQILKRAELTDLSKVRVPISISRFIKLSLGDTLRFYIAHQERHFLQAERTQERVQNIHEQRNPSIVVN
ncbi:MAG: DinB family protein [Chitinophagaceae bacterium]|nr:DinB family protein [Chitinophagaceae bacterium]